MLKIGAKARKAGDRKLNKFTRVADFDEMPAPARPPVK